MTTKQGGVFRGKFLATLLVLFSVISYGQQTNNVPWYQFSNKLGAGKFQLLQIGEYSADFTIPNISGSLILDTISADRTVTFPTYAANDKGVLLFVVNTNSSAFVWNVSGSVFESLDGSTMVTVPRGMHIFRWHGDGWLHMSGGSGGGGSPSTDTLTFTAPIYQLNKNVYLEFSEFPTDTVGVKLHGSSLYNVIYHYDGVRDSSFIVDLNDFGGGGGGTSFINVVHLGVTGDTTGGIVNDTTLGFVRLRDSGNVTISKAPDGALVVHGAGATDAFVQDGNSFSGLATIGTNDANALSIETGGTARARYLAAGGYVYNGTSLYNGMPFSVRDSIGAFKLALVGTGVAGPIGTGSGALLTAKANGSSAGEYVFTFYNNVNSRILSLQADGTIQGSNWSLISSTVYRSTGTQLNLRCLNSGTQSGNGAIDLGLNTDFSSTSGTPAVATVTGGFIPSSGSAALTGLRIRNTMNQTGTASGDMISLEIDPAVTAVLGRNIAIKVASGHTFTKNLTVNGTTITPSAALEVTSTTQGLLLPRMTKTQRDAIGSPVAGLAVYQTDNTPGLRVYNGTNWMRYTETAD